MRTRLTGGILLLGHFAAAAVVAYGYYLGALVLVLATHCFFLWGTLRPNSSLFGSVAKTFLTKQQEVWLTIDDGVCPKTTPALLDSLKKHGVRASFFVVGRKTDAHPELMERIASEGHQIANHTQTHPHASFWAAFPWTLKREIGEGTEAFRSPVGMSNWFVHSYLKKRGLRPIGWSVRGLDGIATPRAEVTANIDKGLRPGAIVLIHDGYDVERRGYAPVDILEDLMQLLEKRGYQCTIPPKSALLPREA
ncbi:MAG: polysaccharide deacetylase family protein [Myxococcales bacterium]|nr:polysaccharide deacetylase family protein [Myxococcales bacterium]